MPQSKGRHPHKHNQPHQQQPHPTAETRPKPKKVNRTVTALVLFFAILGLCVGLFINAGSIITLLASTALGAIAGFVAGYLINKSLSGK